MVALNLNIISLDGCMNSVAFGFLFLHLLIGQSLLEAFHHGFGILEAFSQGRTAAVLLFNGAQLVSVEVAVLVDVSNCLHLGTDDDLCVVLKEVDLLLLKK